MGSNEKSTNWGDDGPQGTWKVKGSIDLYGDYEGTLSLTKQGGIFSGSFESSAFEPRQCTGVMFNGSLLLARSSAEDRPGVVWYTLATNGDLDGVWNSSFLGDVLGTGRAVSGKPGEICGVRPITYFDSNGNVVSSPTLKLEITRDDQAFALNWIDSDGSETVQFTGIGVTVANGLASGWDTTSKGLKLDILVYEVDPASGGLRATAEWATTGSGVLGKESMSKK